MRRIVAWWRKRYGITITPGQEIKIRYGLYGTMHEVVESINTTRHVSEPDVSSIRIVQITRRR